MRRALRLAPATWAILIGPPSCLGETWPRDQLARGRRRSSASAERCSRPPSAPPEDGHRLADARSSDRCRAGRARTSARTGRVLDDVAAERDAAARDLPAALELDRRRSRPGRTTTTLEMSSKRRRVACRRPTGSGRPAAIPAAAAAAVRLTIAPTTLVRGVPTKAKKAAKIMIASRKLATGPASTIRKRCHTGRSWKARSRSSGGMLFESAGLLAGLMSPTNFT